MAKLQAQSQLNDEEFEIIADKLADEFALCVGSNLPVLSDYAVTRESIYEDHPFTSRTQIFVDSHKFYE